MKLKLMDIIACPYDKHFPLKIYMYNTKYFKERNVNIKTKPLCDLYCARENKKIYEFKELPECVKCLKEEVIEGVLYCSKCGRYYPIINGIPVLLSDDLRDQQVEHLKMVQKYAEKYEKEESSEAGTVAFLVKEDEWVKRLFGELSSGWILDEGCGTGRYEEIFRDVNNGQGEIVGIDFSPNMLKIATKKFRDAINVHFILGTVENLPFRSEVFNVVIQGFGIPSYTESEKTIKEGIRVCKTKGKLLFTVYNKKGINLIASKLWVPSLVIDLDIERDILRVAGKEIRCIAYTVESILKVLIDEGLILIDYCTFPVLTAFIPKKILDYVKRLGKCVRRGPFYCMNKLLFLIYNIDCAISHVFRKFGAYIILLASKR